jgi:hypothetical protein
MKKNLLQHTKLLVAFLAVFSLSSCEKTYFEDINKDPNNPTEVPPKVLLPTIQASLAYAQGGDLARYTSLFTQQITGNARQFAVYNNLNFTESDFDNLWRLNLYAGPLMDNYTLIKICKDNNYIHYGAVAKIMMAYSIMLTTDVFGDIPYTEAFQGTANISPVYDRQELIYSEVSRLINEGIAELAANDPSGLQVKGEDLVFGGDYDLWTKFAHSLEARHAIHLTKRNGTANAALEALEHAGEGFGSNDDDAQLNFGDVETAANPWYQFDGQRGDISYSGYLIDTLMPSLNDPRSSVYSDGSGGPGAFYNSINSPVMFMTYAELKFIEAEAHVYLNEDAEAQLALTEAVLANMSKLGITDTGLVNPYLRDHCTLSGTQADRLNTVMTQKYIAMYQSPEAWTDWRRTGIPSLSVPADAAIRQIPRRFLYPQSEAENNGANVNAAASAQGGAGLTNRVWWDN